MSNKKSLLTESEIRRFMKLANIPAVGGESVKENMQSYQEDKGARQMEAEKYPQEEGYGSMGEEGYGEQEEMGYMSEEDEMPPEEGGEMPAGDMGGGKEAKFQEAVGLLADLVGLEVDFGDEAGGAMAEPDMGDMGDAEGSDGEEELPMTDEPEGEEDAAGDEEEEEEEEEEDSEEEMQEAKKKKEEDEEGEEKKGKKLDEALVNTVLARVTARLIAEAKKKKAEKKKKMSAAEKMKAMKAAKDKKKKSLEEANAPAPKSSMSNASKTGKGHGPGKTEHGVHKGDVKDVAWGSGKGGHEMKPLTATGEHTISHGKTSKVTGQGGNKKK